MTHPARFQAIEGRHAGERVVLIVNGPSLNRMDLSFLRREVTIGVNRIFLGTKKFGFYPRYYVAVNNKLIAQSAKEIGALNCVKFISARNSHLLAESALTYHINTSTPPVRFCRNIAKGVYEGWTVTYAALQIAFHLGFREVVIIGMDHRRAGGDARESGAADREQNSGQYSADCFGGRQNWDHPDLSNAEESYRIARTEFEDAGRLIIDATLDGECTVFEKADYRQVFARESAHILGQPSAQILGQPSGQALGLVSGPK